MWLFAENSQALYTGNSRISVESHIIEKENHLIEYLLQLLTQVHQTALMAQHVIIKFVPQYSDACLARELNLVENDQLILLNLLSALSDPEVCYLPAD